MARRGKSDGDWIGLTIGRRIRAARVRRKLAPTLLAAYCGVTDQVIGRWEADRAKPRPEHLFRMAEAFDMPANVLIKGGDDWEAHLANVRPLASFSLFMPPSQWRVEAAASRPKEEVQMPEPGMATAPPQEPAPPSADEARRPIDERHAAELEAYAAALRERLERARFEGLHRFARLEDSGGG